MYRHQNIITERKKYIAKYFDKKDIFIKNRFAKSFGSFLAFNNNIAVVPYKEDRTSNTIRLTYQDATKDIKIPSPDYQIHLSKQSNLIQNMKY